MSAWGARSWLGAGVIVMALVLVAAARMGGDVSPPVVAAASSAAEADIPAEALRDYQDAARTCRGLPWTVLAGIGKVESNHGRSDLPGVHSGANFAGAMGPMQFLRATWDAYHLPGMANVYAHRDASFAAAHLLCANGGATPDGRRRAIYLYNHDWNYVNLVLNWAGRYAAAG